MSFQLRSDRYEKKKIPYIKFSLSLFIFLFITQLVFPKILPAFFARTFFPLFPIKVDERDQIIETLNLKISSLEYNIKNNANLTSELSTSSLEKNNLVTDSRIKANVIKLPPFAPYDSLVLDKGLTAGIDIDDLVQVGDITIGKIKESYVDYSRVEMFSSPGQEIEVRIGTTSIPSTAFGRGAGNFEVLYPREAPIKEGDQVIIPSVSSGIYSFVNQVISDPANPFIAVIFTNPISLQSIANVYIKKN